MFGALLYMVQRPGHLRKLELKNLENLEIWCWRRMEKIKW
jgi:hypothetical protein